MASHESEDEDLKAAIAMSLSEQPPPVQTASASILGLNRKAMEEERLARLGRKRERSISPPARRAKVPKIEETTVMLPSGAKLNMIGLASHVQEDQESRKSSNANAAIWKMKQPKPENVDTDVQNSSSSLKYPNGVVKKTWAFGHPRTGGDVKIEEVLEASTLRTAVLSAYQWDLDWILPKLKTTLNGGTTKCVFVMQGKQREERDRMREEAEQMLSFVRLCLPPMPDPVWCMHSKLMLLFHPDKLRIAVPTANLLNFDWGETGQMENSVFMIDLPRLSEDVKKTTEDLTFFGKELMFFIEKQGLDADVMNGVLNFDFQATEGMAFVHTAGGVHYKETAQRTGLLGLGRTIRQLGLTAPKANLQLDFAASSIGQLNEKYLQDFHSSAAGVDTVAEAGKAKADFFKPKSGSAATGTNIREVLRVYFPTKDTVRASTAGAAGTICLQRKYFEAKTFPREIFRDYKSTRLGLLSHNKILCARGENVGWVYVGSSNMSKSAWGELPADRKQVKITCRNWECGVLLPLPKSPVKPKIEGEDSETESESEESAPKLCDMETFKDLIDLPFQYPGEEYDGKEPWYFTE